MRLLRTSLFVSLSLLLACGDPPPPPLEEDCGQVGDEDNDGFPDCEDQDCFQEDACQVNNEDCDDGVDNDADTFTDCDDTDCAQAPNCQPPAENCNNNADDDGDNLVDCADPDCNNNPACQAPAENCNNGNVDDDGDNLADCADPDCAQAPNCPPPAEVCNNSIDDDRDTLLDCFDPNCAADANCQAGTEVCNNNTDDDADGLTDCNDPGCAQSGLCTAAAVGFAASIVNVTVGTAPSVGDAPTLFGATCPNNAVCNDPNFPQCGSCDGGASFNCFPAGAADTFSCCETPQGVILDGFCTNGNTCVACGETQNDAACIPPGNAGFCIGADLGVCAQGDTLVACQDSRDCATAAELQAGLSCALCGAEEIITPTATAANGVGCCVDSTGAVDPNTFCAASATCFTCDDTNFSCATPATGSCP